MAARSGARRRSQSCFQSPFRPRAFQEIVPDTFSAAESEAEEAPFSHFRSVREPRRQCVASDHVSVPLFVQPQIPTRRIGIG